MEHVVECVRCLRASLAQIWAETNVSWYTRTVHFLALLSFIAIMSYTLPLVVSIFHFEQNLKKKYKAEWALVTGGSQGIGKAYVDHCARQGLNVVIVAYDDHNLPAALKEFRIAYPKQEFRAVGVDFTKAASTEYDYMTKIADATKDIEVQIVFNNAGFLLMGNFIKLPILRQVGNLECNMISHIKIAHYFMSRMAERKLKGCVHFTGSANGVFPFPGNAVYCAGKAALQQFVLCLGAEFYTYGIDVTILQPGPVRTSLYENVPQLDALKFFNVISSTPDDIATIAFRSVGRFITRDTSLLTWSLRLLTKLGEPSFFIRVMGFAMPFSADFKKHDVMR